MEMKQIATIDFTDAGSGDEGILLLRAAREQIAMCVSLKTDGDLEVLLDLVTCSRLLDGLRSAIAVAQTQ